MDEVECSVAVDKVGLVVSTKSVMETYVGIPVFFFPSGDTEGQACKALAKHVVEVFAGAR